MEYTCCKLQHLIDNIDKELAEIRVRRKTLLSQKKCFKREIERILRQEG